MDRHSLHKAATIALGVASGIGLFRLLSTLTGRIHNITLVVLTALFLAFAFEPAVSALQRRGARRGYATGFVLFFTTMALLFIVTVAGAVAMSQFNVLLDRLPDIATDLDDQLTARGFDNEISTWADPGGPLQQWSSNIRRSLLEQGSTALPLIGYGLAVGFLTFYFSVDLKRIRRLATSLAPTSRRPRLQHIWDTAVERTGRYLYSRVLLAALSTGAHVAAFVVFDIPYPVPLGIWVGVVSQLVPVLGAYLAGLLPVVISLTYSSTLAVTALVIITVYQQIENLLLAPRITRSTVQLHPAVGFLSVLTGAATLGPIGALFAVPMAATVAAVWESSRHTINDPSTDLTALTPDQSSTARPATVGHDAPANEPVDANHPNDPHQIQPWADSPPNPSTSDGSERRLGNL